MTFNPSLDTACSGSRKISDRDGIREEDWLTWSIWEQEPKDLHVGSPVRKLGGEFIWSPLHLRAGDLQPARSIGDPFAQPIFDKRLVGMGDDVIAVSDCDLAR